MFSVIPTLDMTFPSPGHMDVLDTFLPLFPSRLPSRTLSRIFDIPTLDMTPTYMSTTLDVIDTFPLKVPFLLNTVPSKYTTVWTLTDTLSIQLPWMYIHTYTLSVSLYVLHTKTLLTTCLSFVWTHDLWTSALSSVVPSAYTYTHALPVLTIGTRLLLSGVTLCWLKFW